MHSDRSTTLRSSVDPRWFQIAALGGLLAWGVLGLGFDVSGTQIVATLATALLTQVACAVAWDRPHLELPSALISSLSLCLLLRTGEPWLAAVAAVITVTSKFLLRIHGKHIFNPTNFGLVVMLVATDRAWVSAAQWGTETQFAFAIACVGLLVIQRAARADVTLAFLGFYATLLFARALWLGDPLTIPLHQLQSGALLLFAFFMISDPKTTPDSRAGRLVYAGLVALGAAYVQFGLFRPNGLLFSLVGACLLVPLLDRLLPGARYEWPGKTARPAAAEPRRAGSAFSLPSAAR